MGPKFKNTEQTSPHSIAVDDKLLHDARELEIDVTRAAEAGIARAISAERRSRDWAQENAEVVASNNAYIEKHGLPLQKYRVR